VKRTTVKIPDEVDARLRKEAELRGTTVSALVREAIERFLPLGSSGDGRRRLSTTAMFEGTGESVAARAEEILASIYEKKFQEEEELRRS